jgi:hypothetical protein
MANRWSLRRRAGILPLGIVIVGLFGAPAHGIEWIVGPAVEGEFLQIEPHLIYDDDAEALLLAYEHTHNGVKLTKGRSRPSGLIRWELPVQVEYCELLSWPRVASSWPNVYILWTFYISGHSDLWFNRSTDGGSHFEESLLIETYAVSHDIAVDPTNGEIVLLYWHPNGVLLRRSQDGGSSFLASQAVDSLNDYVHTLGLAIGPDGVYHVAYVDSLDPPFSYRRVNYRRSTDQGETWDYHRIDESPERCSHVVLGLDGDGNPMIGWIDVPMARLLFRRSWDEGLTFEPIVPVDTSETTKLTTTLAVDDEGNPHLAWWGNTGGQHRVWYACSENAGQSFLPAMQVAPLISTSQRWPTIAIGASRMPVVVWIDYRNDPYGDLWYGAAIPTGVEQETVELAPSVEGLRLLRNYPNPFHSSTSIAYELPQRQHVSLRIYDVLGRLVCVLVEDREDAGRHLVVWSGLDQRGVPVSSGVYLSRLESGSESVVETMVLLK